jgi:hypothetical protein
VTNAAAKKIVQSDVREDASPGQELMGELGVSSCSSLLRLRSSLPWRAFERFRLADLGAATT